MISENSSKKSRTIVSSGLRSGVIPHWFSLLGLVFLVACSKNTDKALGTLEWDRINSRAVASETIIAVYGREGDLVKKGDIILELDASLQTALVESLKARVAQAQWLVKQRETGYRTQEIAAAEARLKSAESSLATNKTEYQRQKELLQRKLTSQREVDRAENTFRHSQGEVQEAQENLDELRSGYRSEEVEQARAALAEVQARLRYEESLLQRYTIVATRAGLLDSIPFKLGDKPPVGAVLSTILAGDQPWARVYIPELWMSRISIGDEVFVYVDGREAPISGHIRYIESKASFTPYYALAEEDRSRLSYVSEIDLDPAASGKLPVGIPVQVVLTNDAKQD